MPNDCDCDDGLVEASDEDGYATMRPCSKCERGDEQWEEQLREQTR